MKDEDCYDAIVIRDSRQMAADVGGYAVFTCKDDVKPAATSLNQTSDVLDQAELVGNGTEVNR